MFIGISIGVTGGGVVAVPFTDEATAFIARASVPPTKSRQTAINKVFKALKASGDLDLIDYMRIIGADSQVSLLNWAADGAATLQGTTPPTFTEDRDFTASVTSGYIDTGMVLSTMTNLKQDDHAIAIFTTGNIGSSTKADCGTEVMSVNSKNGTKISTRSANSAQNSSVNDVAVSGGCTGIRRTVSAGYELWKDGAKLEDVVQASAALTARKVYECGRSANGTDVINSGSNRPIQALVMGGAFDQANVYAAIRAYLDSIGAP